MSHPPAKSHEHTKSKAEQNHDLTEQVEDTFPASDPPSLTQPGTAAGAPGGRKSSDTGVEAELARQLEKSQHEHKRK